MTPLFLSLVLFTGASEVIDSDYRAVTIETGSRRQFRVPMLETVTGSSGRCVEEGMSDEHETIWIEATCDGVRTSMVWRTDNKRFHVMACAEDVGTRSPSLLKLRQKVQGELKGNKSVTACVRNGKVEVWGWFRTDAEEALLASLQKKYGLEQVKSFAERLKTED